MVEIQDVSFAYEKEQGTLSHINLQIGQGEFFRGAFLPASSPVTVRDRGSPVSRRSARETGEQSIPLKI